MEKKIERILELAGNKNKYQNLALLLTFLLWVNLDLCCNISTSNRKSI